MMAALTLEELMRIFSPFMSAGVWMGRFALITRKPLSQYDRPTMPRVSSFLSSAVPPGPRAKRCTASMSLKM